MSSSGSLAETSLPSIFHSLSRSVFSCCKGTHLFWPLQAKCQKTSVFRGYFSPHFCKKISTPCTSHHFFHFSSFLSFLTPHSSALRDGGREHGPLRAGKFPAPCAGGLSYMLHYLSLLMPSAGATIWLQCVTKPTFSGIHQNLTT